jgi:hypothetical protein
MNKEDLLLYYFSKDVSGNEIDGMKEHHIRTNPKLIKKNKYDEFEYVMDILIPEWRRDKELMRAGYGEGGFHIERVAYEETICICTQPITEICYLKHITLDKSVQVGNHCVGKINKELEEEAKRLQRIRKKEIEAKRKQEMIERIKQLDKERDELVAKIEKEYDDFVLSQLFRECITCKKLNIVKTDPTWKKQCRNCYKK